MREAVGLAGTSVGRQRENGALADEVRGGVVLVQVGEDGGERLARVELRGGRRVLRVHVHDEVRVFGEERHLTFRVPTVGAVAEICGTGRSYAALFEENQYEMKHAGRRTTDPSTPRAATAAAASSGATRGCASGPVACLISSVVAMP